MNNKLPNPRNLAHGGAVSHPTRSVFQPRFVANWPAIVLVVLAIAIAFAVGWHLRGAM